MNADTLYAIDTLHIQIFQRNLLNELLRAKISLKQHLKQSELLAIAQELPPSFRKNYRETSERLAQMIDSLGSMLNDLDDGALSWQQTTNPVDWNLIDTVAPEETEKNMALLDIAEQDILDALNGVGERLVTLPPSIFSWSDCGLFRVHVELKKLPERPCYNLDEPIDFHVPAYFCTDYFAKKDLDQNENDHDLHYLLDAELMPLTLLPLIEDVRIEMEVRAEGSATWRNQKMEKCGKLKKNTSMV